MIGELRDPVRLLRLQRVGDEGGGYEPTYVEEGDMFAHVKALSSVKEDMGNASWLAKRYQFTLRTAELNAADRLLWGGRLFRVTRIEEIDLKKGYMSVDGVEIHS